MRLFPDEIVDRHVASGSWTRENWSGLARRHARERGDHVALIDAPNRPDLDGRPPGQHTWAELDRHVDVLAATMFGHGVRAGDVVGIQLPNVAELAMTYIALARLGAIATPFPVQYREHELGMLFDLAGATSFVTANQISRRPAAQTALAMAAEGTGPRRVFVVDDTAEGGAIPLGGGDGDGDGDGDEEYRADLDSRTIHPADCATICWTSGTESVPKGIPRAFCDWSSSGHSSIDAPRLTPDDRLLLIFPMVNMGGLGGMFNPWMLLGATMVMHHPFDLEVFLQQAATHEITYTNLPPAVMTRLLQSPGQLDRLSSLRAIGTGSAPVPESTIVGWEARGVEVINFFGSNEGLNLVSHPDNIPDPAQRGFLFPSYRGDASKVRVRTGPHTEIRLVSLESGTDVEQPGEPGELRLRGPSVFSGYLPGTGRSDPFDADGFYCSGDIFEFADDARTTLRYRGRATELIVRGGFNVSPAEIESTLHHHPDIADVAVVGIPDEVLGDRICACVVPAGERRVTLDEIKAHMDAHRVAKYKWPERVEFVSELPRNPVGKVLYRELRERVGSPSTSPKESP